MRKCDLNDRRLLLSVALETMFSFSHWMWHHNLESIIIQKEEEEEKLNSIYITSSGTRRDNHFENISRHYLYFFFLSFKIGMRPRGERTKTLCAPLFQSPTLKGERNSYFVVILFDDIKYLQNLIENSNKHQQSTEMMRFVHLKKNNRKYWKPQIRKKKPPQKHAGHNTHTPLEMIN